MCQLLQALIDKFPGESIFLCTHAAGVTSIVSFLLKISVPEIEGTWPACLFCLERDTVDSPWKLHAKYNGTHDHLSDVSGAFFLSYVCISVCAYVITFVTSE